jgi:hypothetical protein
MENETIGEGSGRPAAARPLPRGLEQVSHLFISNVRPAGAAVEKAVRGSEPQLPAVADGDSLRVVTRRFFAREQLALLLRNQVSALEEGLKVIDADLPVDGAGAIDLVAVDAKSHVVIVDLDDSPNDGLLLRGIAHADWLIRNLALVRRMYPGPAIDYSAEPRVFLVAPDFSALFRLAARRIASPRIHCMRYVSFGQSSGAGVLFECVSKS